MIKRTIKLIHRKQPVELSCEYDEARIAKDSRVIAILELETKFIAAANTNNFPVRDALALEIWQFHKHMAYQSLGLNTQTAVYLLITCPNLIESGGIKDETGE